MQGSERSTFEEPDLVFRVEECGGCLLLTKERFISCPAVEPSAMVFTSRVNDADSCPRRVAFLGSIKELMSSAIPALGRPVRDRIPATNQALSDFGGIHVAGWAKIVGLKSKPGRCVLPGSFCTLECRNVLTRLDDSQLPAFLRDVGRRDLPPAFQRLLHESTGSQRLDVCLSPLNRTRVAGEEILLRFCPDLGLLAFSMPSSDLPTSPPAAAPEAPCKTGCGLFVRWAQLREPRLEQARLLERRRKPPGSSAPRSRSVPGSRGAAVPVAVFDLRSGDVRGLLRLPLPPAHPEDEIRHFGFFAM